MLYGFSGKLQSGKDTAGLIVQYLTSEYRDKYTLSEWMDLVKNYGSRTYSPYVVRKFADKLKDIVCILLNCTRTQLEDIEFKNKELGEEWWYYTNTLFYSADKELVPYLEANNAIHNSSKWFIIKLTPRLILQLLGTECGRQIIHPNIWCTSLMAEYIETPQNALKNEEQHLEDKFPNWLITDVRFPNEASAIKSKGGIVIRIERPSLISTSTHESETALDNYKDFDYMLQNDGNVYDLMVKLNSIITTDETT